MIPISDSAVGRRRPPVVNLVLIALNILVFLYEISLGERALDRFILTYGLIPAALTGSLSLGDLAPAPELTLITSMFVHGGWLHVGGNMLYLWVFGDNVEDRFGHLAYLAFYFITGIAAALAQVAVGPESPIPTVGASGAVAGVLGAYVLLHPGGRVTTLLTLGFFIRIVQLPALLVIGFWGVLQFFSGVASLAAASQQEGGVAYWAHIGGLVAGLVLGLVLRLILPEPRSRYRSF